MFRLTASCDGLERSLGPFSDFKKRTASEKDQQMLDLFPFFTDLIKHAASIYDISDDPKNYVFAQVRALHADKVNGNGDRARSSELVQYRPGIGSFVFKSFVGKPHLEEHDDTDLRASHGILVNSSIHLDEHDKPIRVLVAVDRNKNKKYADDLLNNKAVEYSMGCFPAGTKVYLADGTQVPIEEVVEGELVFTHTGHTRPVTKTMVRPYEGDLIHLQVTGLPAPITPTPEHPFLVLRPKQVCACGCGESLKLSSQKDPMRRMGVAFKKGHDKNVYNPHATYSKKEAEERKTKIVNAKTSKPEWVEAKDLAPGDYLLLPRCGSIMGTSDSGVARARLLGYFLAEGSFLKKDGIPVEVEFSLGAHESETLAKEISSLLVTAFGVEARTYVRKDRGSMCVRASGPEPAAWFLRHGGEYADGKRLSREVLTSWPQKMVAHLLATYFLGDGHTSDRRGLTAATVSPALSDQLTLLLGSLGVYSRTRIAPARTGHKQAYYLDINTHSLVTLNAYLGEGTTFALPVADPKRRFVQNLRETEDFVLYPIKSVTQVPFSGNVYNFEVDGDNSYLAGGVAVHNCLAQYTVCDHCSHLATTDEEWCDHMKSWKGRWYMGKLMSESIYGVEYQELSRVASAADKGAKREKVLGMVGGNPKDMDKMRSLQEVIRKGLGQFGGRSL